MEPMSLLLDPNVHNLSNVLVGDSELLNFVASIEYLISIQHASA